MLAEVRTALSAWWRSSAYRYRFDYLLGEQSGKRLYCLVFGILLTFYAVIWGGALFSVDGPATDDAATTIAIISGVLAVSAVFQFAGWWPSTRVSLIGLVTLDAALFVGALSMSNDLIGLLILFMYGPVGFLIGFRHGAKALTAHCAAAIGAIVLLAVDAAGPEAGFNVITVADIAVALVLLTAGLPVAAHVIFDLYRIRAIDAQLDPLTDLLNRRGLEPRWQHMLAIGRPRDWLVVICADLDGFKPINDVHGHRVGDVVLRRTAAQIVDVAGPTAFVARTGGDEFTVLARIPHFNAERRLSHADEIRRAVKRAHEPVEITVSVGVAAIPYADIGDADPGEVLRSLMAGADAAMYAAKRAGGDRSFGAPAAGPGGIVRHPGSDDETGPGKRAALP